MLIGEYIHTIDAKNRVSLPFKFRKEIGKKMVITPGLEQCLFIFTIKEWEKVSRKLGSGEGELSFLQADKRSFNRYMFGRAVEVEVDSIGRILIPDFLKDKIDAKDRLAFVGVQDRIEIWNAETWKKWSGEIEKRAESLAEKIGNEK